MIISWTAIKKESTFRIGKTHRFVSLGPRADRFLPEGRIFEPTVGPGRCI
jgi:hypothetical protein